MRQISRRIPLSFLSIILLFLFAASTAEAQYFGRNKVQYRDFKFEVLKTDHFDIYFYDEERAAAADVARMAERWYARLSVLLDHNLSSRQPLVLYASHAHFEQTNVVGGEIGEGTGGVTEGLKRRVVLPLTGALRETDHVLGHELVHAFQYDMARLDREDQPGGRDLLTAHQRDHTPADRADERDQHPDDDFLGTHSALPSRSTARGRCRSHRLGLQSCCARRVCTAVLEHRRARLECPARFASVIRM